LPPSAIGYVNAHGTGTQQGDVAEAQATWNVFGAKVPVSSLKSYMDTRSAPAVRWKPG